MACGLLFQKAAMQIPYDLEFVENRPTVGERAVALSKPLPIWPSERPRAEQDAFDALLHWALKVMRRFETNR